MQKIRDIIGQIKQYTREGNYAGHYFENIIRILLNISVIDYRVISHGNKVVHSSDYHRII